MGIKVPPAVAAACLRRRLQSCRDGRDCRGEGARVLMSTHACGQAGRVDQPGFPRKPTSDWVTEDGGLGGEEEEE